MPPSDSKFEEKLIEEVFEVEFSARELFDKGILVEGAKEEAQEERIKLIESKACPILQATFITVTGLSAKTNAINYT